MAQEKRRILIVDEENDVGGTFKIILENYGFDIDYYTDPAAAVEQFKPNLYDLTILDINLPNINGFELYDQLESRDSNIKTLFITALSTVEPYNTHNRRVYPLKGKRHFMAKPVSRDELMNQVYSLIGFKE
jgi:DNA-binding response OmpR family regulator